MELRRICAKENVLHAYVCVMAWGRQDKVPGGRGPKHVRDAWAAKNEIEERLLTLREGRLSRSDAYKLFLKDGKIPGLGPSFFTKLLFFFSRRIPRGERPYIVDNVVLNAVATLTGLPFTDRTSVGGYRACCEEMDRLGLLFSCSGRKIEERLFSWRPDLPGVMHQNYPHIPEKDFR